MNNLNRRIENTNPRYKNKCLYFILIDFSFYDIKCIYLEISKQVSVTD